MLVASEDKLETQEDHDAEFDRLCTAVRTKLPITKRKEIIEQALGHKGGVKDPGLLQTMFELAIKELKEADSLREEVLAEQLHKENVVQTKVMSMLELQDILFKMHMESRDAFYDRIALLGIDELEEVTDEYDSILQPYYSDEYLHNFIYNFVTNATFNSGQHQDNIIREQQRKQLAEQQRLLEQISDFVTMIRNEHREASQLLVPVLSTLKEEENLANELYAFVNSKTGANMQPSDTVTRYCERCSNELPVTLKNNRKYCDTCRSMPNHQSLLSMKSRARNKDA